MQDYLCSILRRVLPDVQEKPTSTAPHSNGINATSIEPAFNEHHANRTPDIHHLSGWAYFAISFVIFGSSAMLLYLFYTSCRSVLYKSRAKARALQLRVDPEDQVRRLFRPNVELRFTNRRSSLICSQISTSSSLRSSSYHSFENGRSSTSLLLSPAAAHFDGVECPPAQSPVIRSSLHRHYYDDKLIDLAAAPLKQG